MKTTLISSIIYDQLMRRCPDSARCFMGDRAFWKLQTASIAAIRKEAK